MPAIPKHKWIVPNRNKKNEGSGICKLCGCYRKEEIFGYEYIMPDGKTYLDSPPCPGFMIKPFDNPIMGSVSK